MRVRLLYFGVLREHFGAGEQWLELDLPLPSHSGPLTVGILLDQLQHTADTRLQALWPRLAVAVNQHYARREDPLAENDEVALLPPVSGGLDDATIAPVLLTHAPLETESAVGALKAGSDGAVVVFDGIVRDNTRGRRTRCLEYEAYEPMALDQMRQLVADARERFAIRDALLHHRLGRLEIGETSVLIAVASPHRGAAFDACRWIIDSLKKTVPIWKKEHFTDGALWADGEPFPDELQPGPSA